MSRYLCLSLSLSPAIALLFSIVPPVRAINLLSKRHAPVFYTDSKMMQWDRLVTESRLTVTAIAAEKIKRIPSFLLFFFMRASLSNEPGVLITDTLTTSFFPLAFSFLFRKSDGAQK